MIGSRARLVLLGVLAVFVVGAGASGVASAANLGPFWHVAGKKLGQGVSKAIINELTQPNSAQLYAEAGNKKIEIKCKEAPSTGKIWNGTQHGENEETIKFKNGCKVFEIVGTSQVEIKECEVKEPITAEASSSLWFITSQSGTTTIRTSKIAGVFAPKQGKAEPTVFAKVTIVGLGCGALEGIYSVEGNTAAKPLGSFENEEVTEGKLEFPTEQIKHVWQPTSQQLVESQIELKFNAKEAKLVGEAKVELSSKEKFGVFTE